MGSASRGTKPIYTRTVLMGSCYFIAESPRSPVRILTASSTGEINILPSPDFTGKSSLLYGLDNFVGVAVLDYHFNPCPGH